MSGSVRAAAAAKGLAALAGLVVLVVGVPVALWQFVGWPLPHAVPDWAQVGRALTDHYIPDQVLINALAIVCWIVWGLLAVCVVVETVAAVRGRAAPRVPLAGPLQPVAARLVATIALAGALTGPRTPAVLAPLAAELSVSPASVETVVAPALVADAQPEDPLVAAPAAPLPIYVVQSRDDLWSIAERHLADPYRWTEIWQRNQGRTQPDGRTFTDPDLICPGWILELPADAVGLAPAAPAVTNGSAPGQLSSPDAGQAGSGAATTRLGAPSAEQPSVATPASPAPPSAPENGARAPVDGQHPAPRDQNRPSGVPGPVVTLPSGAIVGLTLAAGISVALAAARLHRRRRHQPADPEPGIVFVDPLATDLVRCLRRADLACAQPADDPPADHQDPVAGDEPESGRQGAAEAAIVTIGERDGQPIPLDVSSVGGLCLTGPAAGDVARAAAIDFLAAERSYLTEIVIAGPTLAQDLFGDLPPILGVGVVDSLDAALGRLEVELIHRTRLLDDADTADFHTFTRQHPEEPIPAVLLAASSPEPASHPRLDAVLGLGRRLGLGALILGSHPALSTITVDGGGHVAAVEPAGALPELTGARLCTLNSVEAAQLHAVLAAGRGSQPGADVQLEPDSFPPTEPAGPTPADAPISVRLLGPMCIEAAGAEIATGLRSKARELLAYVLLHPRGATAEAAADALWPDADPTRSSERFHTTLANLRSTLRTAAGLDGSAIVERKGTRYQIDAALISCDLWKFETALAEASSTDDDAAIAALQQATTSYGGDLVEGAWYEWAEPAREDLRRRAVNALARLAELHEKAGDPEAALAVLDQAVRHDPYAEALYQPIMRLQATLGRPDAVRRTYRLLETRLTDLDTDPEPATAELLHQLLKQPTTSAPWR